MKKANLKNHLTMFCILLCGTLACSDLRAVKSEKISLAENGKTDYVIIQEKSATNAEKIAAGELADYLGKVTGAQFAVVLEGSAGNKSCGIYVGQTDFAREQDIDFDKFGEEEWLIRTAGDNLIITGGRPRGTLYGVYEFLEQYAGCRWLAWDTEVIPSNPNLSTPAIDKRGKPAFYWRDMYTDFHSRQAQERKSLIERFNLRNRQQSVWDKDIGGFMALPAGSAHTFYIYVDPREWFETHPEYFSMDRDGKRTPGNFQHRGAAGSNLCLSNPEVAEIAAKNISRQIKIKEKEFAENEGIAQKFRVVNLVQEDNANFICMCPECKKISEREGSESGLLIQFANRVAELLTPEYPDIKIRALAYVSTDKPPITVRPNDNVIVWWADLYGKSDCYRPLTHPVNRIQAEYLRGWAEISKEIHLWDYWDMGIRTSAPAVPALVPAETISSDMRFFRDNRVTGILIENEMGVTQQSFYDLSVWVGLQLLNNPDLDADKLVNTFISGYYGSAAKAMRQYYDFLAKTLEREPQPMFRRIVDSRIGLKYMNMDFLIRCREMLAAAEEKTTENSPERIHVWRDAIVVYNSILNHWDWLKRTGGKDFPFSREEILGKYEIMRRAVIEYQYSGKRLQNLKEDMEREITVMRTVIPLPEQFRSLPEKKRVMDFPWTKMAPWNLKDDPEAAGGRATVYNSAELSTFERPLRIGTYDRSSKRSGPSIHIQDIPQDEKYHVYKIGRFSLGPDSVVWVHGRWLLSFSLEEAYQLADGVQEDDPNHPNLWDVYISLKLTGPFYVEGSTKTNAIWVDRVTLVKP